MQSFLFCSSSLTPIRRKMLQYCSRSFRNAVQDIMVVTALYNSLYSFPLSSSFIVYEVRRPVVVAGSLAVRASKQNVASLNTWAGRVKNLSMCPWASHITIICSRGTALLCLTYTVHCTYVAIYIFVFAYIQSTTSFLNYLLSHHYSRYVHNVDYRAVLFSPTGLCCLNNDKYSLFPTFYQPWISELELCLSTTREWRGVDFFQRLVQSGILGTWTSLPKAVLKCPLHWDVPLIPDSKDLFSNYREEGPVNMEWKPTSS